MYRILCLVLLFLSPLVLFAQEPKPLVLHNQEDSHDLTTYIEVLEDSTGKLAIDDILSKEYPAAAFDFHPLVPGTNYKVPTHWVRFRLINQSDYDEEFKISIAFTDSIRFFIPYAHAAYTLKNTEGLYTLKETGDLYNVDKRDVRVGEMVFVKFMLPKGKGQTYYMRLHSASGISQEFKKMALRSFKLYSEENFEKRFNTPRLYQALFYGALLIMIVYNLFIFISLRSLSYMYYVLYMLSVMIFLSANSGYLAELVLTDKPRLDLYIRFFSTPVLLVCYLLFSRSFLNVSRFAPKFDKLIKGLLGLFAVPPVMMLAGFWSLGRTVVIIMAVFTFLLILAVAVRCMKKGFTPARFFIVANVLLLLGAIIFALTRLVIVVQNPFTKYVLQISLILEIALFSLGLADRINLMRKELSEQVIEKERLEKQQEIERKKLIEEKNKELEVKVEQRTAEVVKQKEEIEKKNKHITDSIQYAQRIQRAILGNVDEITGRFKDAFVFFSPKDIVSGDFYWFAEIEDEKASHPEKIIIASDCTGHGVPGAFMTVMGCALLNEIVNDMEIRQPDRILHALDQKIQYTMQKQGGNGYRIKDGMDLAILHIDEAGRKLRFAGAKNPMCYIRNGEFHEVKGSKFPIGESILDLEKAYELHTFDMQEGDLYYIFSDGFQDQFSEDQQKYMKKRFRNFLLGISHLPMAEQRERLEQELREWRGSRHQTDDVLIIGIKA